MSPEFSSWRSYWQFAAEVSHHRRYIHSQETSGFLALVAQQAAERVFELPSGRRLFRAQKATHGWFDDNIGDEIDGPALPERMLPLSNAATEGRVNPKGIPCLYMAGDEHTAIAEVRPWIGTKVSVGAYRTLAALRLVDCTLNADKHPLFLQEPDAAARAQAVWSHIAQAFRQPTTREDDRADYAPTQILAETFRAEGFDGVAYRSGFGTDRFNIAFFALNVARLEMCTLYEIRNVELDFQQAHNPYYVRPDEEGGGLVRNVVTAIKPLNSQER